MDAAIPRCDADGHAVEVNAEVIGGAVGVFFALFGQRFTLEVFAEVARGAVNVFGAFGGCFGDAAIALACLPYSAIGLGLAFYLFGDALSAATNLAGGAVWILAALALGNASAVDAAVVDRAVCVGSASRV